MPVCLKNLDGCNLLRAWILLLLLLLLFLFLQFHSGTQIESLKRLESASSILFVPLGPMNLAAANRVQP